MLHEIQSVFGTVNVAKRPERFQTTLLNEHSVKTTPNDLTLHRPRDQCTDCFSSENLPVAVVDDSHCRLSSGYCEKVRDFWRAQP